jgi:hypothetical protein
VRAETGARDRPPLPPAARAALVEALAQAIVDELKASLPPAAAPDRPRKPDGRAA